MEATQTANPPTFETVWATLDRIAKRQEETDRILKETAEERLKDAEERLKDAEEAKERRKEIDRQMKETDRQIGKLGNRMGEVVEYMIAPNLREKFRELGLIFPQANLNSDVSDYDNDIFLEIDVKLENGDKAMLVEVKTKLSTEHIQEHIERIEKMRKYADLHGDKRTFLGAVAGVVVTANVKEYALKQGFFVIEPSGETFNITAPNGKPKEW